ncbi:MAG TPA: hypothetical protein VGE94_11430 [Chloroflexota bacterium]
MFQLPSLRLALGLGDQELEQRLRPAFDAADDVLVVAQCLAADQVLQAVQAGAVDGVVVAWTLHRLTDALLEQLERSRLPVILLAADPDAVRWRHRRGPVLPLESDAAAIRHALLTARRGERPVGRVWPASEPIVLKPADRASPAVAGRVVAVVGGAGSPGRTTVALNLATALGTVAPTALVEADLDAPALAAYLDRDPSRNLCTLAHAVGEDPHAWNRALAEELQPVSPSSPSAVVLCGPPKREMRTSIAAAFVERLVRELASRYRYVVLDIGAELLGMDNAAANHRAALGAAHEIVVVSRSDLVGLWHTRTALDLLERQCGVERSRPGLVLNRYDARHHHSPAEVAWHLGAPVVAVVAADHAAAERAIAAQRPLVTDRSSRAGRALLQLAERIHAGKLRPLASLESTRAAGWWERVMRHHGHSPPPEHVLGEAAALRAAVGASRQRRVTW